MQRKDADYFMLLLKNDYRDLKVDHFHITKVFRDLERSVRNFLYVSQSWVNIPGKFLTLFRLF